jgi:hypothetical protein
VGWFYSLLSGKIQSTIALSPSWRKGHIDNQILAFCVDDDETQRREVCNRRRVLNRAKSFGALLLGGAVAGNSSVGLAEENDPFVAMDSTISAAISSNNFGSAATISKNPSTIKATNIDPGASMPSQRLSEPLSATSDLERALKESRRRKTIDPRTHG